MIKRTILMAMMAWMTGSFATEFKLNSHSRAGFPNTLGQKDFFLFENHSVPKGPSTFSSEALDCRAHIAKVICLVEPMKNNDPYEQRTCLPGGDRYIETFQTLYDHYPPVLQKVFCSLNHLYIEKNFFGTAYAGLGRDKEGRPNGAIMGIRQSVIDENLDLPSWASWKEQLSFGGVADSYTVSPDLPIISSRSTTTAQDFLYFVIAHEFGHILDFANDVNKVISCDEDSDECEMHEESWGALSWITSLRPRPENEFANRRGLCFYWCNGSSLKKADVPQIYRDLNRSNFISLYATTQPWDDFADSLAYISMQKNLRTVYQIDTRQGDVYDVMERLNAPTFQAKREYLENFLKRSDLKYP